VGLGERAVLCVRNSDAALDSFCELGETGLSGAAIINDQGKLVGNLSRHDLLGTQGGTGFGVLNQSIMHYQRKHRVALAQRLVTGKGMEGERKKKQEKRVVTVFW
jgi:hypothetical protein